jgi:hypothetical protein
MTQAEFGPALGWSHRSAVRWDRGGASPTPRSLEKLAALLAPVDLELAAEAARFAGTTLEALGLLAPEPPAEIRAAPAAANMSEISHDDRADLVVLAAAEATDGTPNSVRALLHAALARAATLGLTVEQLEASFRGRLAASAKKTASKGGDASATEVATASPRVRVATKPAEEAELERPSTPSRRSRAH